jgi:hypothetical protein
MKWDKLSWFVVALVVTSLFTMCGVGSGDKPEEPESGNPSNWTAVSDSPFVNNDPKTQFTIDSIVYGGSQGARKFVAGGYTYNESYHFKMAVSTDGLAWREVANAPFTGLLGCISYIEETGLFIAAGDYHTSQNIASSPDGETWTALGTFTGFPISAIAYGGPAGAKKFVAVGAQPDNQPDTNYGYGKIATSPDGVTWTEVPDHPLYYGGSTGIVSIGSVVYAAGRFVAGGGIGGTGGTGKMAYSTDGTTWLTASGTDDSRSFTRIVYAANKFVALGYDGRVARSSDGVNWTVAANTAISGILRDVTYGAGYFVMIGEDTYSGKIASSKDGGATWALKDASALGGSMVFAIAYGANRFVMVGGNSGTGAKIAVSD